MNPIDKIKQKLTKYPEVQYETDSSSITILPATPEGFSVSLIINSKDSYTVHFEGWHENFDEENEALGVFALGLSGDCRLREYHRGNFAYKWIVDFKEDGEWLEQSTTGLLVFPFWRKKRMRILQNRVIT
jgi:hypothetical protein